MSGIMTAALVLALLGALLARVAERLVDWLIPRRLNHSLAAAVARLAIRIARSELERQEAEDSLANTLAPLEDAADVSPLSNVMPVLARCLVARLPWRRPAPDRPAVAGSYRHTNSKGVSYYLNSKLVTLIGGTRRSIYYFSKDTRPETACWLPADRRVEENPRNGLLVLARKQNFAGANDSPLDSAKPAERAILLSLRAALRVASAFPLSESSIASVVDECSAPDQLFARAREIGLSRIDRSQRSGHLPLATGAIAESVAQMVFADLGYSLFWQITKPGVHGVDLLIVAPDESVLALEVKGTLRAGRIPRLTPSALRQMSRGWLDDARNAAMAEWSLSAEDLYAGVMVVDLAAASYRLAMSGNFSEYLPIVGPEQLRSLRWLD